MTHLYALIRQVASANGTQHPRCNVRTRGDSLHILLFDTQGLVLLDHSHHNHLESTEI